MKFNNFVKKAVVASAIALSLTACSTKTVQKHEDKTDNVKTSIEVANREEVLSALKDSNSIVIDARINDAYNGWAVQGAKRGGHLKGAIDFSANWLSSDYDEKENLEKRTREEVLEISIKDKNITPDKKVIIYDINDKDAKEVANYLIKKDIKNIKIYNASELINSSEIELEKYPKYELLVAPSVVKDIIDGKTPNDFTKQKNIKIFDVSWGDIKESKYIEGHVPTAVHINTDSFEPPKEDKNGNMMWMLADSATLEKLLLDNGITSEDCVIVTGAEPMAAFRFGVICQYMGVKDVRVMNGGLINWKAYGFELAKDEVKPIPANDFGIKVPVHPELIMTLDELQSTLSDPKLSKNFQLVDNRTWEEHIGKESGYSYHNKKGRIPGSIFGHAGINTSSSMCFYRNIDKTMRNLSEIKKMWNNDKIDTSKKLAFMCGSGWRAAEVLWYSKVMGMDNTTLYSDGWIRWSNEGLESEVGEPKN